MIGEMFLAKYENKIIKEIQLKGMRSIIGKRMTESKNSAPHVTLMLEADVTCLWEKLQEFNCQREEGNIKVSFTALLIQIVAVAIKEFPRINARLEIDRVVLLEDVNIGIAVALEEGVIVPVIRDVYGKSVLEINAQLKEIVQKARSKKLTPEAFVGGTFTISNLGMYAVDGFTPLINLPESAILGVGRICDKPAVLDGNIVPRKCIHFSLSFDHRVIDGAPAAKFLTILQRRVETPEEIR